MGVVLKSPQLNICPIYLTVSPEIPLPNFCQPSKVCPNSPGCTEMACTAVQAAVQWRMCLTLPLYLRVFSRIFNSFQLTVTSHRTKPKHFTPWPPLSSLASCCQTWRPPPWPLWLSASDKSIQVEKCDKSWFLDPSLNDILFSKSIWMYRPCHRNLSPSWL